MELLKKFFSALISNSFAQQMALNILKAAVKRTDNTIDDAMVETIETAMAINNLNPWNKITEVFKK